jgi:hypothetical protein
MQYHAIITCSCTCKRSIENPINVAGLEKKDTQKQPIRQWLLPLSIQCQSLIVVAHP